MKLYRGKRDAGGATVTVDGQPLDPRPDLMPQYTAQFEWGYDGTGPSRLGIAILADCYGDDDKAVALHKQFVGAYLALLQSEEWQLRGDDIEGMLDGYVDVPMTLDELLRKVRGLG